MTGHASGIGAPPLSYDAAIQTLEVVQECLAEGFPYEVVGGGKPSARSEAAKRIGITPQTLRHRLTVIESLYRLKPDLSTYRARAPFTFDDLPHDGEPTAEEMIARLTTRHEQRRAHHEASRLRQVAVNIGGPIAVAFFGDPHVDDPGCAWGDLERDVRTCRDTPGMLAVDVGDNSNNWVGRLMRLYADQEVTPKQSLKLIEWLMTALPWLLWEDGNHDTWNTEKGDPTEVMHRLLRRAGLMNTGGTRLQLNLPAGASFTMHVRHDFPGGSQFNPAHALVRETLFGFRDHLLACGHRHTSGYIPVWHNDPMRLCHGMRLGTYKDFDKYAREKGFQEGNWARSMAAVVDPDLASDPVRFIKVFFSLGEAAEYLTWRRAKWSVGKTPA
jgi:hypothetical protein